MERALRQAGRDDMADQIRSYDKEAWAHATLATLRLLAGSRAFVPWPDTGRGWARHLPAEDADWLRQFLPANSMEK